MKVTKHQMEGGKKKKGRQKPPTNGNPQQTRSRKKEVMAVDSGGAGTPRKKGLETREMHGSKTEQMRAKPQHWVFRNNLKKRLTLKEKNP